LTTIPIIVAGEKAFTGTDSYRQMAGKHVTNTAHGVRKKCSENAAGLESQENGKSEYKDILYRGLTSMHK
jgi:hypothetical protein